jgi:hypothetical protein
MAKGVPQSETRKQEKCAGLSNPANREALQILQSF